MTIKDARELRAYLYWSDAFFNWRGHPRKEPEERARLFLRERPSCPFTAERLARDYRERT